MATSIRQALYLQAFIVTLLAIQLSFLSSEASSILPAAADLQVSTASPPLSPPPQIVAQQSGSSQVGGQNHQTVTTTSDQPTKLPKINIYVNKHEIKKLLGINERINYVTNGNLNTYPLGFTIPLGFNHSDIIFTWQNLGQTNVNYSISLVIGDIQAVMTPSINITRSGQIPKQEQVFKITLPCSGKVTTEVDVQVLINIVGMVDEAEQVSGSGQATESQDNAMSAFELGTSNIQSDQPSSPQGGGSSSMRLVSHQLAIKRKKICTQHPVMVVIPPPNNQLPAPKPPTQQAPLPMPMPMPQPAAPQAPFNPPQNRWPKPANQPPASTMQVDSTIPLQKQAQQAQDSASVMSTAHVDHQPQSSENSFRPKSGFDWTTVDREAFRLTWPPAAPPALTNAASFNGNKLLPAPSPIPENNPINEFVTNRPSSQQTSSTSSNIANNPLLMTLVTLTGIVTIALIAVVILGSSHRKPLEKLNTLTSCLLRRTPAHHVNNKCKSPMASAVLSSLRAGPKSSASSVSGLSAISGHSKSYHSATGAAAAGALTVGAMGTGNGGYCFKTNTTTTTNCAGFYTNSSSNQYHTQQHHHYQQPPTADLLGTGYQCNTPAQQPPHYPLANTLTNGSQMTRLIWNNGNGTSPDGFIIDGGSYMPYSNGPISDNGSAYQTIY